MDTQNTIKILSFDVYNKDTQAVNKYLSVNNTLYKCFMHKNTPIWINVKNLNSYDKLLVDSNITE